LQCAQASAVIRWAGFCRQYIGHEGRLYSAYVVGQSSNGQQACDAPSCDPSLAAPFLQRLAHYCVPKHMPRPRRHVAVPLHQSLPLPFCSHCVHSDVRAVRTARCCCVLALNVLRVAQWQMASKPQCSARLLLDTQPMQSYRAVPRQTPGLPLQLSLPVKWSPTNTGTSADLPQHRLPHAASHQLRQYFWRLDVFLVRLTFIHMETYTLLACNHWIQQALRLPS